MNSHSRKSLTRDTHKTVHRSWGARKELFERIQEPVEDADVLCIETQNTSFSVKIVVCDDFSADDTHTILDRLNGERNFLRLVRNSQATSNRPLDTAQGEFFVRVDADSTLKLGTLQKIYKELKSGEHLVFGKINVKNTEFLHPAASQVGKIQGDGMWYGGTCFAGVTQEFVDSGGFDEEMIDAEVQELKHRAKSMEWSVVHLENTGVASNFPTEICPGHCLVEPV